MISLLQYKSAQFFKKENNSDGTGCTRDDADGICKFTQ